MMYRNEHSINGTNACAASRTQPTRPPPLSGDRQSIPSPADGAIHPRRGNIGTRDMDNNGHVSGEDRLLTREDLAILQLVGEGLPLASVARRMQMSPRTIRRRLRSICDRLGVAHPVQAIVWAARRGLI